MFHKIALAYQSVIEEMLFVPTNIMLNQTKIRLTRKKFHQKQKHTHTLTQRQLPFLYD